MTASVDEELVLAGVILILIVLMAFKNPALLLLLPLLVLTLNQTTIVGGTSFMQTARWVALGVTASFAVLRLLSHTSPRRFGSADLVILAFIVYAFISSSYAADPETSFQRSLSLLLIYLSVFWMGWYYADLKGEESLIAILMIAAVVVFVGSAAYAFLPDAWQRDGRLRGLMPNPNAIGLVTSIYVPLLLWSWIKHKSLIGFITFVLAVVVLLLSGSRNGLVSIVAGIVFLLFHLKLHRLVLLVLVTAILLFAVLFITDLDVLVRQLPGVERLVDIEVIDYSSGRIESWTSVIQQIEARPLFGYGFGMDAIGNLRINERRFQNIGVHNSYLAITYQLGITGLILFVVPMGILLVKSIRSTPRTGEIHLTHILQTVVVSGLVAAFFETWTHSAGNAFTFPFWMCVMLLVRALHKGTAERHVEAS